MTKTFICVASGPSLTRADCLLAARTGHPIIAINSSWRQVPECQHLFAADCAWWDHHHSGLRIPAKRWSTSALAKLRYSVNFFMPPDRSSFNSGQRAIQLAASLGASQIVLLGYDCSLDGGIHWHGEHPAGLNNPDASSVYRWQAEFARLAEALPGIDIINCSRRTELTCFPRLSPEEALGQLSLLRGHQPVASSLRTM